MLISKILGVSIDTLDTPVTRPLCRIHQGADIEFEGFIAFFIKHLNNGPHIIHVFILSALNFLEFLLLIKNPNQVHHITI